MEGKTKRIKELSRHPVIGIVASAIVVMVEMWHSDLGGEEQFGEACGLLGLVFGLEPEQVEELVQKAYEAMKALLGDEWEALKLNLSQVCH